MTRLAVLRTRDFRIFYVGYVTSLLGSSMSIVAIVFAVLRTGGSASDLGLVLAARTAPQVMIVLAGGVAADRLGRRRVMLAADAARCGAQAALASLIFLGAPPIWAFAVFAAIGGIAQGIFSPALSALTVEIAPAGELGDANALFSLAGSIARIAGPVLAGLLITVTGPGVVIAIDAASFGASVAALTLLRIRPASLPRGRSPLGDLTDGWREFRAHSWLTPSTLQFTFINMLVWGPFLLLGPVLASQGQSGPAAWGMILAGYGAGSVAGGLLALGRRPRRPLAASVVATLGYGLPCTALAFSAPLPLTVAAAILAGTGSALSAAFAMTVLQQQVPAALLGRVRSIQSLAAFAASPAGLMLAGPAADIAGARTVLAFAAAWSTLAALATLASPSVRQVRWGGVPRQAAGQVTVTRGSPRTPGATTRGSAASAS